jgi:tripartite-type tricarboxylate transporter receptor subunit TctC
MERSCEDARGELELQLSIYIIRKEMKYGRRQRYLWSAIRGTGLRLVRDSLKPKREGKKMKNLSSLFFVSVFSLIFFSFPPATLAQFPDKPITILVGYAPGGSTDSMARVLAEHLGKLLGQKIVVENKTGGGGIVCWTALSQAKPDGYTLGVLSNGTITSKYVVKGVMFSQEDFEPFTTLTIVGIHFLVKKGGHFDMPLQKLVDKIRERPGEVKVGLSGTYNSNDFTRILFQRAAKIALPRVPFKGDSEVIPAVLGEHVALGLVNGFTAAKSLYQAGKINSLAVSADIRDPFAPEVPTLEELGFGFSHSTIFSIGAPKGMPRDRFKILADAIKKVMESQEMQEDYKKIGLPLRYTTPQGTLSLWKSYDKLYGQLSKELGIEPK